MSPAAFPCQRPGGAGPCHASRFLAARGFSGVGRALRARLSASRHDLRSTARGAAGPPRMALAGMRNAPCARPRALHPLRGQLSFRPHPRPSARPFAREPDRPLLPPPSTRFAAPLILVNNRRHLNLTPLFLPFTPSLLSANRPPAFNLLDYGTVPDGKTKNTAAIAACAQAGGGTILFPAGQYLAGSILPESDQTLHLEAGAELLYSGDPADSPLVAWRWECTNVFTRAPLIYAEGKHTIAITGRGTLNGQGWNWWWRSNSRGRKSPSRPRRRRQPGRVARPLRPHRTRRKTRRRRLHPGRPIPPPFPHRSLSPQKRPRRRHHPLQFPHVDAPPRLLRRCRRARHPLRLRRSRGPALRRRRRAQQRRHRHRLLPQRPHLRLLLRHERRLHRDQIRPRPRRSPHQPPHRIRQHHQLRHVPRPRRRRHRQRDLRRHPQHHRPQLRLRRHRLRHPHQIHARSRRCPRKLPL